MSDMIAVIVLVLVVLVTVVGFFYWRRARREYNSRDAKKGAYHGVKEGSVTFLDSFKHEWWGSPWAGRPRRGGILGGFSFVAMTGIVLMLSMVLLELDVEILFKYDYAGLALMDVFLCFTWVCFRQNRQALKMAEFLSKDTVRAKELYQTAFKFWPTRVSRWIAPWLGVVYYFKFKKKIASLPEYCCPTCGAPMEKDETYQLSEEHKREVEAGTLVFEPFRCSKGHEFVMVDRGTRFDDYPTRKVYYGFE